MVVPQAAESKPSQQAVQGAMELTPTKLASHCQWQTVLESLVLSFFIHAVRQVSKYPDRAQEELK